MTFLEDKMEVYRNWLFKKRNDSIKGGNKSPICPYDKRKKRSWLHDYLD